MFDNKLSLFWQLSWKILAGCIVLFGIGAIFMDPLSWGLGCLLGGVFTIIRLKMMEISVEKSVHMDENKAVRYARAQYIVRYLLSGVVLAAAALVPWIDPISTVLAMLMLKLATYVQGILDKKYRPEEDYPIVEWEEEEDEEDEAWDRWQTYSRKAGKKMRNELKNGMLKKQPAEPEKPEEAIDKQISLFDDENQENESL